MKKILLADTDESSSLLLMDLLDKQEFEIEQAKDSQSLMSLLAMDQHDLVILDYALPKHGGLSALQNLRRNNATPVIFLFGHLNQIQSLIKAKYSAEDYILKPYNTDLLIQSMQRAIDCTQTIGWHDDITQQIGRLIVDGKARQIFAGVTDKPLDLTATEFEILATLLANSGKTLDKPKLSQQILRRSPAQNDYSLDIHLHRIQNKLQKLTGTGFKLDLS